MDDTPDLIKQPLIILAPGRCYSTALCAMLAQHPQFYGLMETQLFAREALNAWFEDFGANVHSHGLLRTVAQMLFGEQSPKSIKQARNWLLKRVERDTTSIFLELTSTVYPLIPIDNSPMVSYEIKHMERALESFPEAHFLHLTRNPVAYGNSLLKLFRASTTFRQANQSAALLRNPESIYYGLIEENSDSPTLDPQHAWFLRHSTISSFTSMLPPSQHLRIRIEDLLTEPSTTLRTIATWMGVRVDPLSIEKMLHPERWPFACMGPWNARLGGDPEFLRNPELPYGSTEEQTLEGTVPWRDDGMEFRENVKRLAMEFGYA
jgi:hypothetical protein